MLKFFPTQPNNFAQRALQNVVATVVVSFRVKFQLSPNCNLRGAVNALEQGELIYGGVRSNEFSISAQRA
jgi:hypothetical protein